MKDIAFAEFVGMVKQKFSNSIANQFLPSGGTTTVGTGNSSRCTNNE